VIEVEIGLGWLPGRIVRENEVSVVVEVFKKCRKTGAPTFKVKVKREKIREPQNTRKARKDE